MPRELNREKPELDETEESSGLDEFRTTRVTKETSSVIAPGWSSDMRPARTQMSKIPRFKVPDDGEEVLIKFLDPMPFAPIHQHWLMVDNQRRAYTCIAEYDPDTKKLTVNCPLCDRGDKAKSSDWFNVVVLGDDPELQVWYATADPSAAIKDKAEGKRSSPINKAGLYFAVSKKKAANGFNTYHVETLKEDELEVEWGAKPLTSEIIAKFNSEKYDGSLIKKLTSAELSELARKHLTDD